jgi:hypothetical protein
MVAIVFDRSIFAELDLQRSEQAVEYILECICKQTIVGVTRSTSNGGAEIQAD